MRKVNVTWLKVRGLPTKGNTKELRERVYCYDNISPDEHPPIVPPMCGIIKKCEKGDQIETRNRYANK